MIKKNIYKVIIFPIVILFFGDCSSIIFCDDTDPTSIKENNEENSQNTLQAFLLFTSLSFILYCICKGFNGSFPAAESINSVSTVSENVVNVVTSSQDTINSLQTKVTDLSSENAHFRDILGERDAEIAELRQQNDILYQNNHMNEMHNRRYRSLIKNLRENDTRIDELTIQFYKNSGFRGKP